MINLRDAFRAKDRGAFHRQVAMSDALSLAAEKVRIVHRLSGPETLDALATALVSAVQAMAPVEEWADVGVALADVIQRRLTVKAN